VSAPTDADMRAAGYLNVGGLGPDALAALHRAHATVTANGNTWARSVPVQVVRVLLADGHTWPRAARALRKVLDRPDVLAAWTAVLDSVRAARAVVRFPDTTPTAGTPSTLAATRELLAADIACAAILRRRGTRGRPR